MKQHSNTKLVLVVDDEKAFIESIIDGLAPYSDLFDVVAAANGVQALEIIKVQQPALVVSDIRMPQMDGIELLLSCRRLHPAMPVILVSAYFSEELERSAASFGAAALLHKPLDLNALVDVIVTMLNRQDDTSTKTNGFLANFSLPSFLQLLAMEQKTCTLSIHKEGKKGTLWIEGGQVLAAERGRRDGLDAALEILTWDNADLTLENRPRPETSLISQGINYLLMEAARLRDEGATLSDDSSDIEFDLVEGVATSVADDLSSKNSAGQAHVELAQGTQPTRNKHARELNMASMEEILGKLKDVSGFIAAGAFSPNGELLAQVANAGVPLSELGALANDVLLKAQKSTDIMGVGRGNMVHVTAPKANILVRCLNENTDFASVEPGRAHVHMVLVLETDGNIAMGKMTLEKVIQELAPQLR